MNNRSIFAKFVAELRRRDVIRTGVTYIGVSWLLLQVLDVASQMLIVDVIVGTFTFIFLMCLFPVVLYVSWHFQFTGKGWIRTAESDVDSDGNVIPPGKPGWGSWLGLFATIALSLALGIQYFESVKERLAQEEEGIVKTISASSIAVLPFEDQSPDKDKAYLAIGLAEELTSLLGQTDGFTVAASRSSQLLTEKGLAAVDIGRRLNVETVLTGSVVNIGSRVKVRVELLDTSNGHTLWTENFLRELKDIFELQAEIGRSLVNTLQDKYLESGSLRSLSATSSTDAYVVYLKAREQYRLQTSASMKQARKLYEQAIALDPEYAQAYSGLADAITLLGKGPHQYGVLDNDIALRLAESNIEKAIVREPLMPRAFAILGYISTLKGKHEDAVSALNKAIDLNPSLAIAYMWKHQALSQLQRHDESILALRKAIELDPLFRTATYNLGIALTNQNQFDEAGQIFEQLKIDFPEFPYSYMGLVGIHFSQGDYASAAINAHQAHKIAPQDDEFQFWLAQTLLQLKLTELAVSLTQSEEIKAAIHSTVLLINADYDALFDKMSFEVAANPDNYWSAFEAGWYQAMVGDKNQAVDLLTKNYQELPENDFYALPYCSPAIEVAWALKQQGDDDNALAIIEKCLSLTEVELSSGRDFHELYYLSARIEALRGNSDAALSNLSTAIDKGWREWWTGIDPMLVPLHSLEDFRVITSGLDSELEAQAKQAQTYFDSEKTR